jgi:hypothetical protein
MIWVKIRDEILPIIILIILFFSNCAIAADLAFSPSISLTQKYDSNLLFTSSNTQSDFYTVLKPVFSLTGESETTKFKMDTTVRGEKYFKHDELDAILYDTRTSLSHAFSQRFNTELTTAFVRDTTLETQLEQAGLATVRAERYLFDSGLKESYALSDRLSLLVSEGIQSAIYSSGVHPDSNTWQVGAGPSYLLSPKDTVTLTSSYVSADFEDTSTINTFQEMVEWKRLLGESASIRLGAGWRFTSTTFQVLSWVITPQGHLALVKHDRKEDDNAPVFSGILEKAWSERFSTTLSAGKEQYNSADAVTYDRTYAGVGLKYSLSDLTKLAFDARYDHNEESGGANEKKDYFRFLPSIERKLSERFVLRLSGLYEREDTDVSGRSYSIDRFSTWVELTYLWPRFMSSK